MATRTITKLLRAVDYMYQEPLPSPPREHDMMNREGIKAFDGSLSQYFSDRHGYGDGYVCEE